jgi:hypothetical protein
VGHPALRGEGAKAAGGGMTVHPATVAVEQQRPAAPIASGPLDRAGDGWR